MMARSHESTSALAWAGAVVLGLGAHMTLPQAAAGLLVSAGAGILPDLDHPSAAPAHALGFITREVARGVHRCAGGHRAATHWLLTGLAVSGAVWVVEKFTTGPDWTMAIVALLSLFVARVLGPRMTKHSVVGSCALAVGATWLVWRYVTPGDWLPEAVLVGYLAHLLADTLSAAGVPLLGPFTRHRFRVPFDPVPVDSIREHLVASGAILGVAYISWGVLR